MSKRKTYWLKLVRQQGGIPQMPGQVVRGDGSTRSTEFSENDRKRGKGHICSQPISPRKQRLIEKWSNGY